MNQVFPWTNNIDGAPNGVALGPDGNAVGVVNVFLSQDTPFNHKGEEKGRVRTYTVQVFDFGVQERHEELAALHKAVSEVLTNADA